MRSPGINWEGKLRGQPANPGSHGKWPLKWCVCAALSTYAIGVLLHIHTLEVSQDASIQTKHLENCVKYSNIVLFRLKQFGNSLLPGSQPGWLFTIVTHGWRYWWTDCVIIATNICTAMASTSESAAHISYTIWVGE